MTFRKSTHKSIEIRNPCEMPIEIKKIDLDISRPFADVEWVSRNSLVIVITEDFDVNLGLLSYIDVGLEHFNLTRRKWVLDLI